MRSFYAIDTMGVIYRAHFAMIRAPLINSKGINTSGLHGLVNTLFGIIEKRKPDFLAVVTDTPEPTFRHKKFESYKATREKMPEELVNQLPYIPRIVEALGVPYIAMPGFEADDVIGTLAKEARKRKLETFMVTGDKDYMQLIDKHTVMYFGGAMDPKITAEEGVLEKFGVAPDKVIEVLSLMGDASDNVPGVKGVGPKTATKLIEQYGTLENLYEHLDEVKGDALKKNLVEHKDMAFLSRELVTIHLDVPLQVKFDDLALHPKSLTDNQELIDLFTELEFQTLRDRLIKKSAAAGGKPVVKESGGGTKVRTEHDEAAAKMDGYGPPKKKADRGYRTLDTLEAVHAQVERWRKAQMVVMDTETTGLDYLSNHVIGLSFSIQAGEAFYIPLNHKNLEGRRAEVLDALRPVLEDPHVPKAGHNMKFDMHMLLSDGVEVQGAAHDTMISSHLTEPAERRHDLDSVALRRLGVTKIPTTDLIGKGKDEITMDQVPIETVAEYACEDAEVTYRLYQVFAPRLKETAQQNVFDVVEMPLIPVLMRMERQGVRFNVKGAEVLSREMEEKLKQIEAQIYELSGERGWNINSVPDLQHILYEKLALHTELGVRPRKIKTGIGLSTDEETLEKMTGHRLPRTLLEYRQLTKLKSTYLDQLANFVSEKTGKIHTSFRQSVAATGRLASDNPNLQNIPIRSEEGRKVRALFVASDKDHVLMSADYSQIELRVVADYSGDPTFLKAFREGEDIHALTGAAIFGVAPDKVDRDMRSVAKEVNFGLIYRMGADRLAQVTGRGKDEAREFVARYFEKYSTIRQLQEHLMERAKKEGFTITKMARRRYLPEINGTDGFAVRMAEGAAINTPIQGTAAEIIKLAMIEVDKRIRKSKLRSRMVLTIHDELVFDARKEELEELKPLVIEAMEGAMKLKVPLKVDIGVGKTWLEAH